MLIVLNNLKIQQKLTITFGAIVLAILVMGGCVFWGVNGLEKARNEVEASAAVQSAARNAQLHMSRQDAALRAYVMSRNPAGIDAVSVHRKAFNESLDTVKTLNPAHTAKVEEARAGVEKWFEAVAVNGVGLTNMADYDNAALLEPVNETLATIVSAQNAEVLEMAEHQQALSNMLRIVMVTGTLLALLIAVLSGVWLTKGVSKPLMAVTAIMRRLVKGDTAVEVTGTERRDEVGMLASAVAHFKLTTQEKQRAESRNATMQKEAEEAAARREAEREQGRRNDALVVGALADGLENLARGNLTSRITVDFPESAKTLKDDFNAAIESLEQAISLVNSNVSVINVGAEEISAASNDLSHRTEQQAATLEQTAAALDQITATVGRTADGAKEAASVVLGARDDAQRSGAVVNNAVAAMTAIEASSNRIGAIIGVIDEIAFQTNLLALNAGVEAARAGDAGRGFAVVASEVRALAQRSADAAKEIKVLISASSQQVNQGVSLVGQTGDALGRIVDRVAQLDSLVHEIAASAQEQALGLAQVNSAVNQMDQVTQQNAAMVEESTAACQALASEASDLAHSVARFEVSNRLATMAKAKPVAPATHRATPAAPFAAATKPVAQPAAPARPQARPAPQTLARPAVPVRPANEQLSALAKELAQKPIVATAPQTALQSAPQTAPKAAPQVERSRSVAETITALRTTGLGGAALKSQPAEDGWEEF